MRWKRIGRLLYDFEKQRACIFLYAFTFGTVFSKPKQDVETPPFIQGDILYPVESTVSESASAHIGFVTTTEQKEGMVYVIRLEAMPVASRHESGIWLNINDDADEQSKQT
jgi:hypothetical protein